MGRTDFCVAVCLCLLLSPSGAPGFPRSLVSKTSNFVIEGFVLSEGSNVRIAQARVVLCDGGATPVQETATNDSGGFSFQGLSESHYVLRVSASGYFGAEVPVDLTQTSERDLTVLLKPARSDTLLPAPGNESISAHELLVPQLARNLLASGNKKLKADNNPQAALRDFQAATKQAPTYYEAYYQAGLAYLAMQNAAEAENQFRKAVEISQKKYGDADIALGTLLLHRNAWDEGEALLRNGLAVHPNSWQGQWELGQLECTRGHLDAAFAAAQKAVDLAPRQPVVYRLLAVILLRQKNYAGLVSALDSYVALDPDTPAGVRAKELRMQAQQELKNNEQAGVDAKKIKD